MYYIYYSTSSFCFALSLGTGISCLFVAYGVYMGCSNSAFSGVDLVIVTISIYVFTDFVNFFLFLINVYWKVVCKIATTKPLFGVLSLYGGNVIKFTQALCNWHYLFITTLIISWLIRPYTPVATWKLQVAQKCKQINNCKIGGIGKQWLSGFCSPSKTNGKRMLIATSFLNR